MKTFADLTDEEKDIFTEDFYAAWAKTFAFADDRTPDNPYPWGLPWLWCGEAKAISGEAFFEVNRVEIAEQNVKGEGDREMRFKGEKNINLCNGNPGCWISADELTDEDVKDCLDAINLIRGDEKADAAAYEAEGAETDRDYIRKWVSVYGELVIG